MALTSHHRAVRSSVWVSPPGGCWCPGKFYIPEAPTKERLTVWAGRMAFTAMN